MAGIKFGVEPNMREVPPGETATIKLASITKWKLRDTEWGVKRVIPITLFSHPSYDSIPSKGIECEWESVSTASELLFDWVFEDGLPEHPKTFDFDIDKELKSKWKLTRHDTKGYAIEQI